MSGGALPYACLC